MIEPTVPPLRRRLEPAERGPAVTRLRRAVATAADRDGVIAVGETVVIAVSGGQDSAMLLDVLARLGATRGWRLLCAHVDHGLRPGSAAEAGLVAALAAARGVPFAALRAEVSGPGSPQERARRARHAALAGLAAEAGATAIALGHTADDQAETVLMRVLAGAPPAALAAMGVRDGRLARPLLGVWRAQTAAYCRELGIEPLDDPANHDPRYLRTRMRHELLPELERVVPAARRRLVALAAAQRTRPGFVAGAAGSSD